MSFELTAKASIDRNVKFWSEQCGFNLAQVRKKVMSFRNMAYSPREQKDAISAWLRENGFPEDLND